MISPGLSERIASTLDRCSRWIGQPPLAAFLQQASGASGEAAWNTLQSIGASHACAPSSAALPSPSVSRKH